MGPNQLTLQLRRDDSTPEATQRDAPIANRQGDPEAMNERQVGCGDYSFRVGVPFAFGRPCVEDSAKPISPETSSRSHIALTRRLLLRWQFDDEYRFRSFPERRSIVL